MFISKPGLLIAAQPVQFNIAESTADSGLNQYVQQAGRQVLYPFEEVRNFRTNAVIGMIDPDEALEILLRDSGLEAVVNKSGTLAIRIIRSDRGQIQMKKRNTSVLVTGLAALTSLFTGNAMAQGTAGSAVALEEIVVTAQRRQENLQNTPISVAVFSSGRINELNASDPQSLADFVPNLSIGSAVGRGNGGASISIRGVNESLISPTIDAAVGIYIDDVYYGRPQIAFLKLLDVDSVEVLRGPQGTLFGKNSTGGALRYMTVQPHFDEVDGYVQAKIGNYDRVDLRGAVNLPINDQLAVRVAVATLNNDGYVRRLSDGIKLGNEDTRFASGKIRWAPSDKLDITLGVDYTLRDTDDGPTKLIDYFGLNGSPDTTPGGPAGQSPASASTVAWNSRWGGTVLRYNPIVPDSLFQVGGEGRPGRNKAESIGVTLNIAYEFSENLSIRSITGYRTAEEFVSRDPDDQASAFSFFDDIRIDGVDFWSQEIQLNGLNFNSRLNWVAGLYWSQEEPFVREIEDRDGRIQGVFGALILNDLSLQETTSLGVYLQGTYNLTDQISLTAGLRYTRDDKSYTVSQVAVWDDELAQLANELGVGPLTIPAMGPAAISCDPIPTGSCVSNAGVSGGEVFESLTPRFAIQYQWTDNLMAYASASKGFKAGGTNETVADVGQAFRPEKLWSFEFGARTEFLDNRARLNVTYFTMNYDDKQVTVAPIPTNDVPCTNRCTFNSGDATISGWEIDMLFAATDNLQLHSSIGILDARWDTVIDGAGLTTQSDFGRAPDLSYTVGGRYNWPLANGATITALLDYSYTDKQESSAQDSTTLTVPSYGLVSGRLKFTSPDRTWELGIFCSNCTDKKYITGGNTWAGSTDNTPFNFKPSTHKAFAVNALNPLAVLAPGIGMVNIGAPRMFGVDLIYRF